MHGENISTLNSAMHAVKIRYFIALIGLSVSWCMSGAQGTPIHETLRNKCERIIALSPSHANERAQVLSDVGHRILSWRHNLSGQSHEQSELLSFWQQLAPCQAVQQRHLDESLVSSSLTLSHQLLLAALTLANNTNDPHTLSVVHHHFWYYYNEKKDSIAGRAAIETSLYWLKQTQFDPNDLVVRIIKLNTELKRLGQYSANQQYLARALLYLDELTIENRESLLYSAGFLYKELGQLSIAERYFYRSINSYKSKDKTTPECDDYQQNSDVGATYVQLAIIARWRENTHQARLHLACAQHHLASETSYFNNLVKIETARLSLEEGRWQSAITLARNLASNDTVKEAQLLESHMILMESLMLSGQLEEAQQHYQWLNTRLLNWQSSGDTGSYYPTQQIEILALFVRLSALQQDVDTATRHFEEGMAIIHAIQHRTLSPPAWQKARSALSSAYINFLSHEAMQHSDTPQFLEALWSALETTRYVQLNAESSSLYQFGNNNPSKIQTWLKADKARFVDNLASPMDADLAYTQLVPGQSNIEPLKLNDLVTLNDMQARLLPNQLFIHYYQHEQQSFALNITARSATLTPITIPSGEVYRSSSAATNVFLEALSTPQVQGLLPLSRMVDENIDHVIYVPDGNVHAIPLSAINVSTTQGYKPLAAISASQATRSGTAFLRKKQNNQAIEINNVALFAAKGAMGNNDTALANNPLRQYAYLPGAEAEIASIQRQFAGRNLMIARGLDATSEFLTTPLARRADLLHIAAHGIFDVNAPDRLGIITHDANMGLSVLSINELLSHPFSAKLVVISGCDTLNGEHYTGFGVHSLSRAFVSQGAQQVIGTLWPIHDRATTYFMSVFYAQLNQGKPVYRALQHTQYKLSRTGRFRAPRYWAPFMLLN